MTTITGASPSPWRPADGADVERRTLAELTTSAQEIKRAGEDRDARALAGYDTLVSPQIKADARANTKVSLMFAGALAAGVGIAGAVVGALASPGNRLLGMGKGFGGGVGVGALFMGGTFLLSQTGPTPRVTGAGWPADTKHALDEYHGYWERQRDPNSAEDVARSQLALLEGWNANQSVDFVATEVAAFDHDGNGVLDLGADSAERQRDVRGGPVKATTSEIERLPEDLSRGDVDHSGTLDAHEAIVAATKSVVVDGYVD